MSIIRQYTKEELEGLKDILMKGSCIHYSENINLFEHTKRTQKVLTERDSLTKDDYFYLRDEPNILYMLLTMFPEEYKKMYLEKGHSDTLFIEELLAYQVGKKEPVSNIPFSKTLTMIDDLSSTFKDYDTYFLQNILKSIVREQEDNIMFRLTTQHGIFINDLLQGNYLVKNGTRIEKFSDETIENLCKIEPIYALELPDEQYEGWEKDHLCWHYDGWKSCVVVEGIKSYCKHYTK